MKIQPNNFANQAANIINQRISEDKAAKSTKQTALQTLLKNMPKTNSNQVDDPQYNKSYFAQNSAMTSDMNLANMSGFQKITLGVGIQMERSEVFMDVLQRAANYADIEARYETLVANGNTDAKTQALNERALAFYREMGSENSMKDFIHQWNAFDFSKMNDSATGGAVSKETNYIIDDLSSLDYLGLNNLDQMSAAERKQAIVNAMDIVNARINQTPWKTNQTYAAASGQELDALDARHQYSYATLVTVSDVSNATRIGSASISDILEGKYSGRPEVLPEANGETMSYYEYMKSMGVSVTGRVDTRV